MRDIKFRGKRVDGKGMIFGSLLLPTTDNMKTFIIAWNGTRFEVLLETIGQFTGLLDKKGKEIFEGDIFKWGDSCYIIEFSYGYFGYSDEFGDFVPLGVVATENSYGVVYMCYNNLDFAEVIGNIHDNPELI